MTLPADTTTRQSQPHSSLPWRTPLLLPLGASYGLTALRLVSLIPCLVCLLLLLPYHSVAGGGIVLVIVSAVRVWRQMLLSGQILLDSNGSWWLLAADGSRRSAVLTGNAYVHPWCVALSFSAAGQNLMVVLLPGMVASDIARVLRTRLRWFRHVDESS